MNGMTEEEFVVAANEITGFDEGLLRDLWDDPALRGLVPVEITYVEEVSNFVPLGPPPGGVSQNADGGITVVSGRTVTRTAYSYGGFGDLLFTFKTTKSWTYDGSRVWDGGASHSYTIDQWAWEFVSASTSGAYVHTQGTNSGHRTVQSGNFAFLGGIDSTTLTNELTGWKNGSSHTRSY